MPLTLILLAIVLIGGVGIYNNLIAKKNNISNAFAKIDVVFKKRLEMLVHLAETVKEFMATENNLLTRVSDLRTRAIAYKLSDADKVILDQDLKNEVLSIFESAENFPELKNNTNFLQLQEEWKITEGEIMSAGAAYDEAIDRFNRAVQTKPGNILASLLGLKPLAKIKGLDYSST